METAYCTIWRGCRACEPVYSGRSTVVGSRSIINEQKQCNYVVVIEQYSSSCSSSSSKY